jgi:Flp pilus assembly protein TadG
MISSFKRLWRDRRGNALAIAGAALPLVLGSAGLASDTIQWTLWKRQLQRAADSAAMAGVYAIASDRAVGDCSDIAGSTYVKPVAYDLKKNYKVVGSRRLAPSPIRLRLADSRQTRAQFASAFRSRNAWHSGLFCRPRRRSPRPRLRRSFPAANIA